MTTTPPSQLTTRVDSDTINRASTVPTAPSKVVIVDRRPAPLGRRKQLMRKVRGNAVNFRKLDWLLISAALALSVVGSVLVWSATRVKLAAAGDDPQAFFTKHLLNLVVGVVLAWVVTRLDHRTLRAYTPLVYGVTIVALLVVLTPLGTTINGAHAWITLPAGFTLQPGEFAKIAVILAVSMVLSERDVGFEAPPSVDVRYALVWVAIPVLLIMLQPDLGTVLVIGAITIGVLTAAGVALRWIFGLIGAALAMGFLAYVTGVLSQYQIDRLLTFVSPDQDLQGIGYNVAQARIAIGNGGLFGSGLFSGNQTQGGFVPYQQTDFVFSVAGEELGLVGAVAILALLGVVLWRGLTIARAAGDPFGKLVATGVVLWFAFQAFENVGMNIGIMPVTGVPLPFVSYGGTSMFVAWLGIGLLESVHLRSRR